MNAWPRAVLAGVVASVATPVGTPLGAQDTTASATAAAAVAAVAAPPRMSAFLDSAALHAALARVPAPRARRRIERVFVVTFDSAGQPQPVKPAAPRAMPAGYRDTVGPLLQAALRPIAPRRGGWPSLLLVQTGSTPAVADVQLPRRMPAVANMSALQRALYDASQELLAVDDALVGREFPLRIAMRVDEDGIATPTGIAVSSGVRAVDDAALGAMRVIRFRPELLDDEPVPSRVVLPIRFVFPKE